MKPAEVLALCLSAMTVIVTPLMALLWRASQRWTRTDMQLAQVMDKISELVADKDRAHATIQEQVTRDREATDRRLRWLETHLWQRMGQDRKDAA